MSSVKEKGLIVRYDQMVCATGTWADTLSAGVGYKGKTAGAETTTIQVPIAIPREMNAYGVKLKKVLLTYRIATADVTSITAKLYRTEFCAKADASVDVKATEVTDTLGLSHDMPVTAGAKDRLATFTVAKADWDKPTGDNLMYYLNIAVECAATSVLRVYSATAIYEEIIG